MEIVDEEKPTGDGARSERQEPGFTPGPWEVSPTYWARSPWELENAPQRVHSYNVKSTRPYDGTTPTFFAQDIRHKPNALLVAASPALYEACRQFVHWYAEDSTEENRDNAYDAAVSALALVDGKQQTEDK